MVIFNEVHGKLACILDGLAVDKVLPEGLLHQHITAVFFILQDATDAGNGPLRRILEALDALLFQFIFDHPQAGSGEIALIEPSDDFGLFRNDLRLTILTFAVAVQLFILDADLSGFHGAALTPCDIRGDRFTFRLGEGTGEGDSQLTVLLQRIDVFLLEDDCDAKLFERPDIVEAVHRIAGEAGDRFGQDDIDFLLAAVPNHPHEVLTLLGRGSGDALVCKDSGHRPCGVGHDFIGIVLFLHLIAVCLILLFGGDSAVSCHPELSAGFCLTGGFRLGRDLNYSWGILFHCRSLLSMTCPFFNRSLTFWRVTSTSDTVFFRRSAFSSATHSKAEKRRRRRFVSYSSFPSAAYCSAASRRISTLALSSSIGCCSRVLSSASCVLEYVTGVGLRRCCMRSG